MYIDSHIHLSHRLFDGSFPCVSVGKDGIVRADGITRRVLIESFRRAGIALCVEPGIEPESNEKLLALAREYPDYLVPAVGIHPGRVMSVRRRDYVSLRSLASEPAVRAIGELGLDYHYPRPEQHRFRQKRWFIRQLRLAHRHALPLILHIREADRDAIRILRRHRKKLHGGVVHCFAGDADTVRIYTQELGLMLGIGGMLLHAPEFCPAPAEAVRDTPLSALLLETDAPYVRPDRPEGVSRKQWLKTRNTSLILPDVAAHIAELKSVSVEEVERVTAENALRLFRIDLNLKRT